MLISVPSDHDNSKTLRLVVISDDLTGAFDTGVQFYKQGSSVVITSLGNLNTYANDAQVVVIDTESRHLKPEAAYACVKDAVLWAVNRDVPHIYIKTDSGLRGNIGPSLKAALDVVESQTLAFSPAYPDMNRIILGGKPFIDGKPIRDSVFGIDPYNPVQINDIQELLSSYVDNIRNVRTDEQFEQSHREKTVLVFDAESNRDLKNISQLLSNRNQLQLLAGCSAFAYWLYPYLGLPLIKRESPSIHPPLIVLCGSINPISEAQILYSARIGNHRQTLPIDIVTSDSFWLSEKGDAWLDNIRVCLKHKETVLIDTGFKSDFSFNCEKSELRKRITARLGWILKELIISEESNDHTAMIIGGDTLIGFLEASNGSNVILEGDADEGVVVFSLVVEGRRVRMLSKSGGFGAQTLLTDILSVSKL